MSFVIHCTDGQHISEQEFMSEDEGPLWLAEVKEIKDMITNINNMGEAQDRPVLCGSWLKMASKFQEKWCRGGDRQIPLNVKCAVWSVQEGIGVQRSTWSENNGMEAMMEAVMTANTTN